MKLSKIILDHRKKLGLTLEQLSSKSSLSRSYLSKLENGGLDDQSVSLATLIKLSTGLEIKVKEIIDLLNITKNEEADNIPLKMYLRKKYNISNKKDVEIIENLINRFK